MKFRPCIDIHNGKVKQIVGGTISDSKNIVKENFVSKQDGAFYGKLYREKGLNGGHVILLNPVDSEYWEANCRQAKLALKEFPGGLQVGGGITPDNAKQFLDAGASHVIVTSYVFQNGEINYENLKTISRVVGKRQLVLDLSCRKKEDGYYIVTNRWQNFTHLKLSLEVLEAFSKYCDEFLIHAVDVEGKNNGMEVELLSILKDWSGNPITYAGGVASIKDLELLKKIGRDKIDVTVGSALALFGGKIPLEDVIKVCQE